MKSPKALRFWASTTVSGLWMLLSAANLLEGVHRYIRRGHDLTSVVQMIFWFLILLTWVSLFSTSWTFTSNALVQRRVFWKRVVPYSEIRSVDSSINRIRETAIIRYGTLAPPSSEQKLTANPRNYAAFLGELDRHVPASVMHA